MYWQTGIESDILYKTKGEVYTMSEKELSQEAKEARRAYLRKWRRENPEKVKEQERRYWERKAQEMREQEEGDDLNDETIN